MLQVSTVNPTTNKVDLKEKHFKPHPTTTLTIDSISLRILKPPVMNTHLAAGYSTESVSPSPTRSGQQSVSVKPPADSA